MKHHVMFYHHQILPYWAQDILIEASQVEKEMEESLERAKAIDFAVRRIKAEIPQYFRSN